MLLSLQVSMSEAMRAQERPPSSWPQNRWFFLPRAIGLMRSRRHRSTERAPRRARRKSKRAGTSKPAALMTPRFSPHAYGKPADQPGAPIRRPQQQPASIRGDRAAVKRRNNFVIFHSGRAEQVVVILCLNLGSLSLCSCYLLQNENLRVRASMHLVCFRNPGCNCTVVGRL